MAIKHNIVEGVQHHNVVFSVDPLALQYLRDLDGIEIGAAAHNPFKLPGSISVGLKQLDRADHDFFAQEQIKMCGAYVDIDIDAEADDLPLENNSQDYVITSHVVEHLPNLIKAFLEWDRVLKEGGYIYIIFPKRNALEADRNRDVTPLTLFIGAYEERWNVNTVPSDYTEKIPGGRRGHYWVFTLQSMIELVSYMNIRDMVHWKLLEARETDLKVGNGHCVVFQKVKRNDLFDREVRSAVNAAT